MQGRGLTQNRYVPMPARPSRLRYVLAMLAVFLIAAEEENTCTTEGLFDEPIGFDSAAEPPPGGCTYTAGPYRVSGTGDSRVVEQRFTEIECGLERFKQASLRATFRHEPGPAADPEDLLAPASMRALRASVSMDFLQSAGASPSSGVDPMAWSLRFTFNPEKLPQYVYLIDHYLAGDRLSEDDGTGLSPYACSVARSTLPLNLLMYTDLKPDPKLDGEELPYVPSPFFVPRNGERSYRTLHVVLAHDPPNISVEGGTLAHDTPDWARFLDELLTESTRIDLLHFADIEADCVR